MMRNRRHLLLPTLIASAIGTWTQPALANSVEGAWTGLIDWPHIAVSAAALPDGGIVTWSSNRVDSFPNNNGIFSFSTVYDPETGQFENTNNPDHDMFCAGISQLADGNIFASGGNSSIRTSSLFTEDTHDWSLSDQMDQPRWYGTNLTLGNGDVMSTFARGAQVVPEVWNDASGWSQLPGASMQRLVTEQNAVNAAAVTNATTAQWFAFMHTAPDGRVFHSGPTQTMNWFDPNGVGSVEAAGLRSGETRHRQFGSAAMFGSGQILLSGGADRSRTDSATATAMTIDINGPTPVIQSVPDMIAPRTNHDSVVLPNGEVMIVGGESRGVLFSDVQSVLPAEIWNPDTRQWRQVAAITAPRNYHSVALLMRDGRVLASGGGLCGNCAANHQNSQIFTPPFLYNDNGGLRARPSVSAVPANVQAGSVFEVTTDQNIDRFTMVRLSSVTHSVNTDQRFIEPVVTQVTNNRYRLELPTNPNVLLPGNYWLYALDSDGTPSIGEPLTVDIGTTTPNGAPNLVAPANQTVFVGQAVNLALNANDPEGSNLQYTASALPTGLTLNANTGVISGTPAQQQSLTTTVSVTDGSLSDFESFNWTVQQSGNGSPITPGSNLTSTVSQGNWLRFTVAPSGTARTLDVDLSNLSADIDLYVRTGQAPALDTYTCRSWQSGTQAEVCSVEQPANQTVHIGVFGYAAGNFTLNVTQSSGTDVTPLTVGSSTTDSLSAGQWAYYSVNNPSALQDVRATLDNLSADLDLYINTGNRPTLQDYVCRPWLGGTEIEQCAVPTGSNVIIGVHGHAAGQYRLSLSADDTGGGGGGGGGGTAGTIAVGNTRSDTVARATWQYFQITGAASGETVVINLDDLSNDADLYVQRGAEPTLQDFACRSFASGTQGEQCTVNLTGGETWIGVYGYAPSDYRLSVNSNQSVASISVGQQRTASIAQGEWQYLTINNPNNVGTVLATLTGLSADIDLYIKANGFPALSDFDCRSYRGSTSDEDCTVNLSGPTTIGVYGFQAGSYTLSLSQSAGLRTKLDTKLAKGIDVKAAITSNTPISVGGGAAWGLLILSAFARLRRRR